MLLTRSTDARSIPSRRPTRNAPTSGAPAVRILTGAAVLAPVGGIEMCTFQDSAALAQRGHTVNVLYGATGNQRAEYERAGVVLDGPHEFAVRRRRIFRDLLRMWPAVRAARRFRPHVIWLNRPERMIWGQLLARLTRTPLVVHLHHAPSAQPVRLLSMGVAHFVAVSEHTRQQWVRRGLNPKRISVLRNAIPLEHYPFGGAEEREAARRSLGIDQDAPVALYYGHISQEKGVSDLLEAWFRIAGSGALLLLVGFPDPFTNPNFARLLRRLPNSSYRWFDNQADVVPFLHAADVVVVPSTRDESFGRVVVEAMATGRPALATRVGGIPEILHGRMSRFLYQPTDVEELVAKLVPLLTWRTSEPHLAAECRAWVERKFPFDAHVRQLERVLTEHRGRS